MNITKFLWNFKIVRYIVYFYLYLLIFCLIGAYNWLLLFPFIALNILILYMNGTILKFMLKNKVKKEFGKVKFLEKISLFKSTYGNNELITFNEKNFDKKMLDYKKNYLILTESSIIIIGYNSFKDKVNDIYIKDFEFNKIDEILIGYQEKQWTEKNYKTETKKKKIYTETGRMYTEITEEKVPYETEHQKDINTYSQINFKNTIVNSVLFSFINWKYSTDLANKLIKICNKLNIKCETVLDKE